MRTFELRDTLIWKEIVSVELTQEQKDLLKSKDSEDLQAKILLMKDLDALRKVNVVEEKEIELNNFYNSIKPELKENDVYQILAMDVVEKGQGVFTGILNCRINGEHKQIRF